MDYIDRLYIKETFLRNSLNRLAEEIDAAEARGDGQLADVLDSEFRVGSDMLDETEKAIEAWHSGAARRSAECRLAYHVENDTLDLY